MLHRFTVKEYGKNWNGMDLLGPTITDAATIATIRSRNGYFLFVCLGFFLANPLGLQDFLMFSKPERERQREHKLAKARNPVCFSYTLALSLYLSPFKISFLNKVGLPEDKITWTGKCWSHSKQDRCKKTNPINLYEAEQKLGSSKSISYKPASRIIEG